MAHSLTYAGIGSRATPLVVRAGMKKLAQALEAEGYTLRSGAAEGADKAFESGVTSLKEIFVADDATEEALEIAEMIHPAWDRCSNYVRKLHARNGMIVLGEDLTKPVDFILYWTNAGMVTGGTGQALRIGLSEKIPLIGLHNKSWQEALELIKQLPGYEPFVAPVKKKAVRKSRAKAKKRA